MSHIDNNSKTTQFNQGKYSKVINYPFCPVDRFHHEPLFSDQDAPRDPRPGAEADLHHRGLPLRPRGQCLRHRLHQVQDQGPGHQGDSVRDSQAPVQGWRGRYRHSRC